MPHVKRRAHTRVVNGKQQHVRQHAMGKQYKSSSWGQLSHQRAAAGVATGSALLWGYTMVMTLTAAIFMTVTTILGSLMGYKQYKKKSRKTSKTKLRVKVWAKRKVRKLWTKKKSGWGDAWNRKKATWHRPKDSRKLGHDIDANLRVRDKSGRFLPDYGSDGKFIHYRFKDR